MVDRKRILVAGEKKVNLELLVNVLQMQGYETTIVPNGLEVLNVLTAQTFDLVLLDVEMPGMNGLEITTLIRESEKRTGGHLPIVAMNACTLPENAARYLETGMDACLTKPLREAAILETLERFLSAPDKGKALAIPVAGEPGPAIDDQKAILNIKEALARVEGDTALLTELIQLFLSGLGRHLDNLEQGIKNLDPVAVQLAAHSLKGSAGTLSAQALYEAALRLENIGRSGNLCCAEEMLDDLLYEINRFKEIAASIRFFSKPNA
jgi:two-component system, sensor histidine kinase and response regulator